MAQEAAQNGPIRHQIQVQPAEIQPFRRKTGAPVVPAEVRMAELHLTALNAFKSWVRELQGIECQLPGGRRGRDLFQKSR